MNSLCEHCSWIVFETVFTNTLVLNTKTTFWELPGSFVILTDFEVGLWSIQILSLCYSSFGACYKSQRASKIKRNHGKVRTVQKLSKFCAKFYARVQEIHQSLLTSNVHLATSTQLICVFWICNCVPPTGWSLCILCLYPTSNDWSGKMRWRWHASAWSVGLAAQWRDINIAQRSKPANQKHGRVFMFEVLVKFIWPTNRCSWCFHEASWSVVKSSWSRIKNWLYMLSDGLLGEVTARVYYICDHFYKIQWACYKR